MYITCMFTLHCKFVIPLDFFGMCTLVMSHANKNRGNECVVFFIFSSNCLNCQSPAKIKQKQHWIAGTDTNSRGKIDKNREKGKNTTKEIARKHQLLGAPTSTTASSTN